MTTRMALPVISHGWAVGAVAGVTGGGCMKEMDNLGAILDAVAGWECHQEDSDGPPCDAGRRDACYITALAKNDHSSFYDYCNCRCHKDFAHAVQEI